MLEGFWSQQLGQVCAEDGLGHNLQQHGLNHTPGHEWEVFVDQKQVLVYAEALRCTQASLSELILSHMKGVFDQLSGQKALVSSGLGKSQAQKASCIVKCATSWLAWLGLQPR